MSLKHVSKEIQGITFKTKTQDMIYLRMWLAQPLLGLWKDQGRYFKSEETNPNNDETHSVQKSGMFKALVNKSRGNIQVKKSY